MSFNWNKVCSANDFTKQISEYFGKFGKNSKKVSTLWVQNVLLTSQCKTLNNALQKEVQDLQNYVLDIEDFYDEIANLQETSQNRIEERKNRIAELQEKKENGTITKSEETELGILTEEIESIGQETENKTSKLNDFITTKIDNIPTLETQNSISTDYANTTLEISEEFRNQDHSNTKYYKCVSKQSSATEVADSAKEAAENLLKTVDISINTINIFSKKSK